MPIDWGCGARFGDRDNMRKGTLMLLSAAAYLWIAQHGGRLPVGGRR